MSESFLNKRRIAKNTLFLYIRMFITLLVGLYTSRVVLNVLGVSDYGLYNVVGGLVSVMTLLNGAMVGASQRFFSFEQGKSGQKRLESIFSTSLNIHILIAVVFVAVAESFGLYFLNSHMNIASGRLYAANIVYQCSVISSAISMINVPYGASIVAYEKMSVYAYVSIVDVFLKLMVVVLLMFLSYDKLIVYAFMLLCISVIMQAISFFYCRIHFKECRFRMKIDKKLSKEMLSFAGWTIFGEMGFSFKDQMSNILLNLFFGTTVNAARGVAFTVNHIVNSFSSNFTLAIKPQITKQYASGNISDSQQIVYTGARLSFFLMSIIAIPVLINIDYILQAWLGIVPQFTSVFVYITIVCSLFYAMSQPITTAIQATGRIRLFQVGICLIMMSELPLAYMILLFGGKPYEAVIPSLFTSFVALLFRYYVLKKLVPQYDWNMYINGVVIRCIFVFLLCLFLLKSLSSFIENGIASFVAMTLISILVVIIAIFCFGINEKERLFIKKTIIRYLFKR